MESINKSYIINMVEEKIDISRLSLEGNEFVITKSPSRLLRLYEYSKFNDFEKRLKNLPEKHDATIKVRRFFLGGAMETKVVNGELEVSQNLLEYADLLGHENALVMEYEDCYLISSSLSNVLKQYENIENQKVVEYIKTEVETLEQQYGLLDLTALSEVENKRFLVEGSIVSDAEKIKYLAAQCHDSCWTECAEVYDLVCYNRLIKHFDKAVDEQNLEDAIRYGLEIERLCDKEVYFIYSSVLMLMQGLI